MGKCVICKKRREKGERSFFKVPKDQRRLSNWSKACGIELTSKNWVCSDHFLQTDLITGAQRNQLMPNSIPSLYIPSRMITGRTVSESMDVDPLMGFDVRPGMEEFLEIKMEPNVPRETNCTVPFEMICSVPPKPAEKCVEYNSCETQTEAILMYCAKELEIERLKAQNKRLREENEKLNSQLLKTSKIMSSLRTMFTEGQVRKMIMNDKNVQWSLGDISNAICLHASGPRAYRQLYEKGFPLPHETTLIRWYPKFQIEEGMLTAALDSMRDIRGLTAEKKVCVLALDQTRVDSPESPPKGDSGKQYLNYVQVVMARGLFDTWKQPVFYNFDCKINIEILNSIILALQKADFPTVAVVCDLSPTNQKLLKDLGVTPEEPWFRNPVLPNAKIFAFADAPHLLKLLKNHFLETGLIWKGEVTTKSAIVDVRKHITKSNVSIPFKLTDEHLAAKGVGKHNVKVASEFFSSTTAKAIRSCQSLGLDVTKPDETADLIQLINDWYDILNSSENTHKYPGKEPFGLNLQHQRDILMQMNGFMTELIVPGKTSVQQFQKGVLLTNTALTMLYEYIQRKYNINHIMTGRLNQDAVQELFDNVRGKGGPKDHPTPKEFKFKLREYILARNAVHTQDASNEVVDALTAENLDSDLGIQKEHALNNNAGQIIVKQNLHEDISDLSLGWMNDMI